jgi:putative membrane protein
MAMERAHPKARWLLRARALALYLVISLIVAWLYASMWSQLPDSGEGEAGLIFGAVLGAWFLFWLLVFLVIAEAYARLAYRAYSYEVGNAHVRIDSGILVKRSILIPYGRIQNVDLRRGVLERMLGLSSIAVQTAGSSDPRRGAEGTIFGVEAAVAQRLREDVMRKIAKKRT